MTTIAAPTDANPVRARFAVRPEAVSLARAYARWRIGRDLDGLHVIGLEEARAALAAGPVIFAANHVGWWDGLVGLVLDDALAADSRVLAERATVRRLPFLAAMGFVGLRASTLRGVFGFLDRPGRATWIYPQGRHRAAHLRPLGFRPGAAFIARGGAALVPVSIQYVFRDHSAPAVYVRFGAAVPGDALEDAVSAGLDALDALGDAPAATGGPDAGVHVLIPSRARTTDAGLGARIVSWVFRTRGAQ